jgi:hypothetical protein
MVIALVVPGQLDGIASVEVIDRRELPTVRTNNGHMILDL